MLALDLQFSRLDDVIHFLPEAADSTVSGLGNGRKICGFYWGKKKAVPAPGWVDCSALHFANLPSGIEK
jgi:hypothetical protein